MFPAKLTIVTFFPVYVTNSNSTIFPKQSFQFPYLTNVTTALCFNCKHTKNTLRPKLKWCLFGRVIVGNIVEFFSLRIYNVRLTQTDAITSNHLHFLYVYIKILARYKIKFCPPLPFFLV